MAARTRTGITPRLIGSVILLCALAPQFVSAETVQLTITEGTNIAVDASPDGQTLVFDLQGTLFTLPIAGGEATAITDHYGDCRQPDWSPDGTRIAFQSYRSGNWHIWTVEPDGSNLTQITFGKVDDREPTWAPDGKSIVFSSDRAGNYDLWQITLGEQEPTQLTSDSANDYAPTVAPDGETVAFASERLPKGLWTTRLKGPGGPEPILEMATTLAGPSFSPDGKRLLFQSYDRRQTATELGVVELGGENGHRTLSRDGEDVFPFRASWLSLESFLYTGDGKIKIGSVAEAAEPAKSVEFRVSLSFERPEYERKKRDYEDTQPKQALGIVSPAVSPDGDTVAFTALGDLWLLENGKVSRITDDVAVERQPSWSPDGNQLAFLSDRSGETRLWLRDMESKQDRMLDTAAGVGYPIFSPDGNSIAYFEPVPGNPLGAQLKLLSLETEKSATLFERVVPPTRISWASPEAIAFSMLLPDSTMYREGTYRIVIAGPGDEPQLLDPTPNQTLLDSVVSPDGSKVAFVQSGVLKIADLKASGSGFELNGEPRIAMNALAESPSWTGDSRAVVFQSGSKLYKLDLENDEPQDLGLDITYTRAQGSERKIIHAGRLFDGVSPLALENIDIVIEGQRILALAPHSEENARGIPEENRIDASDKTVIPGLFEMHAHQDPSLGESLGRIWLAFGITGIREPGANAYEALERKESWASGQRLGPRAYFAGPLFDGNRVFYSVAEGTDSDEHIDLALERAQVLEYDMIKTYVRMPDEAQRRIASTAHQMGIPTSSHEIFPATMSGMDAVEHIGATSRRGYSPKVSRLGHSYQDVIEILAKSKLNQTPTLVLPGFFSRIGANPGLLDNRQYETFYMNQKAATTMRSQAMAAAVSKTASAQAKTPAAIVAAGGRVTTGTDSPFVPYGFGLHIELQLMVEGGMEPWQVLRSATSWAAEAVGVDKDLGTIEAGKLADLIIVDGNPLQTIEDTLNVEATIKNGTVYRIDDLLEPQR